MNEVRTLRECPERYARSHIGELLRVKGLGLFFKEGNEKGLIYSRVKSLGKGIKIDVLLGRFYKAGTSHNTAFMKLANI
jgi:hypothetical protein